MTPTAIDVVRHVVLSADCPDARAPASLRPGSCTPSPQRAAAPTHQRAGEVLRVLPQLARHLRELRRQLFL